MRILQLYIEKYIYMFYMVKRTGGKRVEKLMEKLENSQNIFKSIRLFHI